ncbi:MAG: DUF1501 domain-containing protein [Planctomycetota bacterium]
MPTNQVQRDVRETPLRESSPLSKNDTRPSGCDEFAKLDRRRLLFGSAVRAAACAGAAAAVLPRVTLAGGGSGSRDVLVLLFLRGGMDGLTLCSPHADGDYYAQRGALAVPPPGSPGGSIDLDGFFGLAPSAAALHPAYTSGDLAFIHTSGSTDPTRSHFEAMKFIEAGIPNQGDAFYSSGWLARHLNGVSPLGTSEMRAMAIDSTTPLSLIGGDKVLAIDDPSDFDFAGYDHTKQARRAVLENMFAHAPSPLNSAAVSTFDTIDLFQSIDFENYTPSGGAVYPDSEFGNRLKHTAALIKADIDLEAIEIDRGGWDDHDNMGPLNGALADRLTELSQALAAFRTDLGAEMNRVTVVAQSEFGRRVDANGSGGTDHGRGGLMMLMGGNVNGGQVYRNWVGLSTDDLDDLALPVQIDYRDVLSEVLFRRMGNPASVFPNYTPTYPGYVS